MVERSSVRSKFDPQPAKASKQEPPKVSPVAAKPAAKPAVVAKPPAVKAKKKEEPAEGKLYLALNEGYKIKLKPDSGYRVFLSLMAKHGHFDEVSEALEDLDPNNEEQATALLKKMMVRRDVIEQIVRADPRWVEHCKIKIQQLQERASSGSDKTAAAAKRTLNNPRRVKDGVWVGDIQEIISTCCGAYENANRNVEKFDAAGITFRKFPLKPSRDEPIFLMMFPSKHVRKVLAALKTVYKGQCVDAGGKDKTLLEEIPRKYK